MPNIQLYELVKNLNQAEKRYFKLFLKRYSHNNDSSIFGQFFDFLVKAKSYDKDELLNKNQYIKPNQLNNIRKRLYNYILLSLRTYNSNSTTNERIYLHQTLINYEILISKSLYDEAWNMLLIAENIAEENEFYYSLTEIMENKKYLITTRIKSKDVKSEVLAVEDKQKKIKAILFYIEKFRSIYNMLYDIFKAEGRVLRNESIIREVKEELDIYASCSRDFENSYQASYLYYYNCRFVCQFTARWEKAISYIQIPLQKFHNSKAYNINRFIEYRRLYTAQIIALNNLNQFHDARIVIEEIKEIAKANPKNKEIDLVVFEDTFFFELESYIHEFNFVKAVEAINLNKEKIQVLEEKMHSVNIQSKRYRIALSYFGDKKYDESLNWINKILSLDKLKFRKDILASVQLLNLLIHYQLRNYKFVKNKIKSVTNYLKKIDRYLIPEQLLLRTISKSNTSEEKQNIIFQELKDKLEEHFTYNRLDSYFFCYLDVTKWIDINYPKPE